MNLTSILTAAVLIAPSVALAQTAPTPAPASAPTPKAQSNSDAKADSKKTTTTVGEVVVTADANGLRTSIDRRSYSVAGDLNASSGSISDALRGVPSVQVDVNGGVSLRGDSNVTILVDGKPSGQFKGGNAAQALQQMPASEIDRVEVMTNPSAQYSPDGSAGIINLITKKTHKAGRTGGARLRVGPDGRINGGINGSWRGEKLTISAGGVFRRDRQAASSVADSSGVDPLGQAFAQHSTFANAGPSLYRGGNASLDYDPAPKDHLSAEAYGGDWRSTTSAFSRFENDGPGGAATRAYAHSETDTDHFAYAGGSTSWRHTFAGEEHDLSVSVQGDRNSWSNPQRWVEHEIVPVGADTAEARLRSQRGDSGQLKADYQAPMPGRARLKAGFALDVRDAHDTNDDSRGPTLATLSPNLAQTDLFDATQATGALYATYEQPIGDLTILGGLRGEQTRVTLHDLTSNQKARNAYGRLYPSLHLAWKLNDRQQLTASVSERVQRPGLEDLNPFRVVYSPFSASEGNPHLLPQNTQSYELAWQYRNAGTYYLATAYYRVNTNGVTSVQTDLGSGLILTTKQNLAQSRNGGLELVANGKFSKTLSYNLSGDAHWNEIDPSGLAGLGVTGRRAGWTMSARGSLNWQATPKDLVQLNGNLSGPTLTPQGHDYGWGQLNLGYRHKLNESFSIILTGQDILATSRFGQALDTPLLTSRSSFTPRNRVFYLGVSYTFGMGAKKDQGFDFGGGGPSGPGG